MGDAPHPQRLASSKLTEIGKTKSRIVLGVPETPNVPGFKENSECQNVADQPAKPFEVGSRAAWLEQLGSNMSQKYLKQAGVSSKPLLISKMTK